MATCKDCFHWNACQGAIKMCNCKVAEASEGAEDCKNYLPTADVEEVRHGRWLPQVVAGVKAWDCSECKTIGSPQWKRCPICEAKMDGGNG